MTAPFRSVLQRIRKLFEGGLWSAGRRFNGFIRWRVGRVHQVVSAFLPYRLRATSVKRNADFALLSDPLLDFDDSLIAGVRALQDAEQAGPIRSALWIIPHTEHIAYGGFYTIFRFMQDLAQRDVRTTILVNEHRGVDTIALKAKIVRLFPGLAEADVMAWDQTIESIALLPRCDIGICTLWTTAYLLMRCRQIARKFYFIQDFEPMFYAAGSIYAAAESTYRFGFDGIVNTPGLERALKTRYSMRTVSFTPAVDTTVYYPGPFRPRPDRVRIFFYARANAPRNAFTLGILVIQKLLERYGDRIEIVTAGDRWDESVYGLSGRIRNLGRLQSLDAVAALYRECDVGFVYMLSKHPSYQPFEFMASGMATVTNRNEDNLWYLKDGINCLLAEPAPSAMAERIGSLVDDAALRQRLRDEGLRCVDGDWAVEIERVWRFMNVGRQADPAAMQS